VIRSDVKAPEEEEEVEYKEIKADEAVSEDATNRETKN
jgi:hypothetical protein